MIGALIVSLAIADVIPSQFEHDLGFPLPESFEWHSEITPKLPIFTHCNEPTGGGCPHLDRGHWDYIGRVSAPRASGSLEPLWELFHENSWIATRPTSGEAVTFWRQTDNLEAGICAKYIELDYDDRDALGLTLHILPCLDGSEQ